MSRANRKRKPAKMPTSGKRDVAEKNHANETTIDNSPKAISLAGGTSVTIPKPPLWLAAAVGLSLIWGVVVAGWTLAQAAPPEVQLSPMEEMSAAQRRRGAVAPRTDRKTAQENAVLPPIGTERNRETALAMKWPVLEINGVPLDDRFETLRDWIHPVTGSTELVPISPGRWFGAERSGVRFRWECGAGHCGVDLDGPRGRPLVAVAAGKVIRVEHHELGLDGRSGRYVRIEHDDGTLTAYMHMDDIAENITVGVRVSAGQFLGTLGATAVYQSAPHCHFTLELPSSGRVTGHDHTETNYIDPSPFLARARVAEIPSGFSP
jgi:murein DD-endopeptidase MepM/ murein hydrolase activator NlpD